MIGHKDSLNLKIPHSLVIGSEHMYRTYFKATDHYIEHANLLRAFFKKRPKQIYCYVHLQSFERFSAKLALFCLQPLLSAALLDHLIHHDRNIPPEYTSPENYNEIQVGRS